MLEIASTDDEIYLQQAHKLEAVRFFFCPIVLYTEYLMSLMFTHRNFIYMLMRVMAFQGYTKPREYIVTEWPLKHTVGEFWSLVYDQECSAVVVLLQPPPNSVSV